MQDYSERIRKLMIATNKIDGVYYYFAKRLGLKENELALLYALSDGLAHTQKEICELWFPSGIYSVLSRGAPEGEAYATHAGRRDLCGRGARPDPGSGEPGDGGGA